MPDTFDLSRAQAPQTADAQPLQDHAYGNLDYTQAPAKAPVDETLGQLAQSLGQFNTHLEQFGRYYEINSRPHPGLQQKQDMEAARGLVATKTHAEFQAAVKAGTVPRFQSPIANELVGQVNGMYTSESLAEEIKAKLGTGELTPQQAPQYALQRRQDILKQNGWGPNTAESTGFGKHFNTLNESLNNAAATANVTAQNEQFNEAGWKKLDLAAREARAAGGGTEASQELFDTVRRNMVEIMHFKPAEVDAMQMDILARWATQDPNWAYRMATTPRKDVATGAVIPPLSDNPKYSDRVNQFGFAAQKHNSDVVQTTFATQVAQRDLDAFMKGDGSFTRDTAVAATATNPVDNTAITIEPAARQKATLERYLVWSANHATTHRETPQQTFDREADAFIGNDVKNPSWSEQIDRSVAAANPMTMSDPAQRRRLVAAGQTYARLMAASPAYVANHFHKRTQDFFDAYTTLREDTGWDDVRALTAAASNASKGGGLSERFADPATKMALDNAVTAKATELATYGGAGGFFTSRAGNFGVVKQEVAKLATILANASGMDPQAAVEQAGSYLAKNSVVQDGQWRKKLNLLGPGVDDTGAVAAASMHLRQQYADRTHGEYKADDLALTQLPGGQFRIVAANGAPVEAGGVTYSRRDLLQAMSKLQEQQSQAHLEAQHKTAVDGPRASREYREGLLHFGRVLTGQEPGEPVRFSNPGPGPDLTPVVKSVGNALGKAAKEAWKNPSGFDPDSVIQP